MAFENVSGRSMTRCFLAEADVPKYLWQEAFRMAVYLATRVPSTPLGGKTSFSMWYGGTTPRLEHLRTFDARAFVHEERYVKKPVSYTHLTLPTIYSV